MSRRFRDLLTVSTILLAGGAMCSGEGKVLYRQKGEVRLTVTQAGAKAPDRVVHVEVKQKAATAIRISGSVRTRGVSGVRGRDFLVVTNLNYERTPIFWYTILYPETGTHPWQRVEKLVRPRLPITSIDMYFRLKSKGEAWFRDFKIEEVPAWKEDADLVIATLGDSTGVVAYMPDEYTVWSQLQNLLRDRFRDRHIAVRCLAASGEYLGALLSSGRLERELDTLDRCDIVVIRYGLNDTGMRVTPEVFRRQLIEVGKRLGKRFPKVQIVLSTTIPPSAEKLDAVTRKLAQEQGLPLIDLNKFLRAEAKRGNGNWHTGTGTQIGYRTEKNPPKDPTGLRANKHPNQYGCRLIAAEKFRVLEPIVAKMLGKRSR